MEKKNGLTIAVIAGGKPPKLGPLGEKRAVPPFGAKPEATETPEYEDKEEAAVEKLAYIRAALKDLLEMCGEDEGQEMAGGEEEVEA